jgi:hypothetical protein
MSTPPQDYFGRFGFARRSDEDLSAAFKRLTLEQGWSKKNKKQKHREADYWATQFEVYYGADATKLEKWQELCKDVGIEPIPPSIKKCKKVRYKNFHQYLKYASGACEPKLTSNLQALRGVHINLVNLLDHRANRNIEVIKFRTFHEFRRYTRNHIFPKEAAKAEGFIKILLREVL